MSEEMQVRTTPEEQAREICGNRWPRNWSELEAMLVTAIEEEREACAQVADRMAEEARGEGTGPRATGRAKDAHYTANAIRARGEP